MAVKRRHRKSAPPRRSLYMLAPSGITAASKSITPEQVGLRGLYPTSTAYRNGSLSIDDLHTLYYEIHGNPTAPLTALFLHGGPGAGCFANHARFFDPDLYQIVLLDQRGAGRSTPRGEFQRNTLLNVVDDCERLRQALNVTAWSTVLGGSWGTTVALAYAQEYPASIQTMILRGVCGMSRSEIDWMFANTGYAQLDPSAWDEFAQAVQSPNKYARETLHVYYDRLLQQNSSAVRLAAARSWMQYEMKVFSSTTSSNVYETAYAPVAVCSNQAWSWKNGNDEILCERDRSKLGLSESVQSAVNALRVTLPDSTSSHDLDQTAPRPINPIANISVNESLSVPGFIPAQNMLTCYYSVNDQYCMNSIDILEPSRMDRIQHIPAIAVHGGQDRVCPVNTALKLSTLWKSLEVRVPMQSSHSMYDMAITNELVRATDYMAEVLLDG